MATRIQVTVTDDEGAERVVYPRNAMDVQSERTLLQDAHVLLMQARARTDLDSDFRASVDAWVARYAFG